MADYDLIASEYLANRERLKSGKYVQKLLKLLPKNATVLDLGCGAGVPVDDVLIKAGHSVIGIDNSIEQIKLARKNCPRGTYEVRDIMELKRDEYMVEAVVSFYTWFHLPRAKQQERLETIASYLKKRGTLLITMGDREFEGEHTLYGARVWSSQFGSQKNRQIVELAGVEIIFEEIDTSGGERHQVILAKKR